MVPCVEGIRVKLDENRRLFTPLARSSYAWKRIYKQRTRWNGWILAWMDFLIWKPQYPRVEENGDADRAGFAWCWHLAVGRFTTKATWTDT